MKVDAFFDLVGDIQSLFDLGFPLGIFNLLNTTFSMNPDHW
jgi:hypothetical protein